MASYPAVITRQYPPPLLALAALLCLTALATAAIGQPPTVVTVSDESASARLSFVPNRGQVDSRVRYYARASGFGAYFTRSGITFDLRGGSRAAALQMRFEGAGGSPTAHHRLPGTINHFVGQRRLAGIPTYEEIHYRDLWPGIDVALRGDGGKLKYEFLVHPGADPSDIRLSYAGADAVALSRSGDLEVRTAAGVLHDSAPSALQGKNHVASRFRQSGHSVGFVLGAYDHSRPLLIDPGLAWSTYLGGSDIDVPTDVASDASGNTYVVGSTSSPDFPVSSGALQGSLNGLFDTFVTKLDANGSLLWSTYLGGSDGDSPQAVGIDGSGNPYVAGTTGSTDFPTTTGTDRSLGGGFDAFVAKFTAAGSLSYSTYLGGNDDLEWSKGIAVDTAGAAYVTGITTSGDFPVTAGAPDPVQSQDEGFVTKLSSNGRSLAYSTFLGGSAYEGQDSETTGDVAVDAAGNAYVTGTTQSSDFPTTFGVPDRTLDGNQDAYLTKINAAGTGFTYSMLLGGSSGEEGWDIAVDGSQRAFVAGGTSSTDYPTTAGAWDRTNTQPSAQTTQAGFVTKVVSTGAALEYSTYLDNSVVTKIALDGSGRTYATGTAGPAFPATGDATDPVHSDPFPESGLGNDAFVARFSADGSQLEHATHLGGADADYGMAIAYAGGADLVVVGQAGSPDFPVTSGALDESYDGPVDGFVTKLSTDPVPGYPRPRGATPLSVPLVPAYRRCLSPNRTHGAPLAFASCGPPVQTSPLLTAGTPDANGLGASFVGRVNLRVQVGNPSTLESEANLLVNLDVRGVLVAGTLAPYTGEVAIQAVARITDVTRGRVTVQDVPLSLGTVQCGEPPVPAGSCWDVVSVRHLQHLFPNGIRENRRSVFQLEEIRVYDSGPDGDADTPGDNHLFATQGILVP